MSSVLLCILILFYVAKPKKGQQRIMKKLEEISFDGKFHHKRYNKPEKKKRNRSMREKARSVRPVKEAGADSVQPVEDVKADLSQTAEVESKTAEGDAATTETDLTASETED